MLNRSTLFGLAIVVCLVTTGLSTRVDSQTPKVCIGNNRVESQVGDGTVWVPLREVFADLGAEIRYQPESKTITVSHHNFMYAFSVGSTLVWADQYPIEISCPITIRDGRSLISVDDLKAIGVKFNTSQQDTIEIIAIEPPVFPELPTIDTMDRLRELLADAEYPYNTLLRTAPEQADAAPSPQPDHSTTNVQVSGIDESDIAKTDGDYIYYVSNNSVLIISAVPADSMHVVTEILPHKVIPTELYVDGDRLIVLGNRGNMFFPMRPMPDMLLPAPVQDQSVVVSVYDISDKQAIKLNRTLELSGRYLSSRKIGSQLYVVSSQHYWPTWLPDMPETTDTLPWYIDSVSGSDRTVLELDEIHYFPGLQQSGFLVTLGVDLETDSPASVSAFLGAGENLYTSPDNLYVAVTRWYDENSSSLTTHVHRFRLAAGTITYNGIGKVPGRIINQFAMDEYNGYFRIATTTGHIWEQTTCNNVYILGKDMNIVSSITDLAPGEIIYSVRFQGPRGYVVTFLTIDPLFVLDLDPDNPTVLGELKIPGFSTYLHPIDDNHVIGLGMEAVEIPNEHGRTDQPLVIPQGLKVSLFDVTDVSDPIEKATLVIGSRGTESTALYNHKALVFDPTRGIMAFPITVREHADPVKYGTPVFQGAYILEISTDNIVVAGKLTHLTAAETVNLWENYGKQIERVMYIDDHFYSLSPDMIKAFSRDLLQEVTSLDI